MLEGLYPGSGERISNSDWGVLGAGDRVAEEAAPGGGNESQGWRVHVPRKKEEELVGKDGGRGNSKCTSGETEWA